MDFSSHTAVMSCPHRALNQSDLITGWIWFSLVLSRHFFFTWLTIFLIIFHTNDELWSNPCPQSESPAGCTCYIHSQYPFFSADLPSEEPIIADTITDTSPYCCFGQEKKKKERYSLGIFLNSSWYSNFKTPNVTQPFRNSEKIHRNIYFFKTKRLILPGCFRHEEKKKKGQIRAFNTCSVHFEAPQHKHAHGYVTSFVKAQREETDWLRGSSLTHCETLAL